jgi:arylsulfatase A-like enzyme
MSASDLLNTQARYAAQVVLTDRWLGKFLDKMDEYNLWENTVLIFTSDHGTFNGDHGRVGKMQTHLHDATGHIPFIVAHPKFGHGERRQQLVQLVDIYPTVLAAVERPCPPDRHGVNLLPVLESPGATTRDWALNGVFGKSVSITDGEWILHQSPKENNTPLYWYDYCWNRFMPGIELGDFQDGRRQASMQSWPTETWLSHKATDFNELENLAKTHPEKLREMQCILKRELQKLKAPAEQMERLGIDGI